MDSRETIAFVVAHPDDVAFSFGGTASLLRDQYDLHVFCASRGERGYEWKGAGLPPPSPQIAEMRTKEEERSCAILGAKLTFLNQPDGEIFAGEQVCRSLAGLLAALRPAALFTHNPIDKPDHAATYGIALHALQLAGLFWTTELYMVNDPETAYNPGAPDVFVNISAVIEKKRELIRCHHHNIKSEKDVDVVLERNHIVGRLSRCDWAEAYASSLPLIAIRWNRRAGSILMDLQPTPGP